MNFKNMSIKKSLIVGFGTTILISALIIIAALIMMSSQKGAYTDIIDSYVESTERIADCRITYNIPLRRRNLPGGQRRPEPAGRGPFRRYDGSFYREQRAGGS